MKAKIIALLFLINAVLASAQEIERDVVASSGGEFSNENLNLSWTCGEMVTETFTSGEYILTQGFQQVVEGIVIDGFDVDVVAFLEGPFGESHMRTQLLSEGLLPLEQPYNIPPWNYSGNENVSEMPPETVDWVLIELRDAPDANLASPNTIIATRAALLKFDGSITDVDGNSYLSFNETIQHELFVVVWHRNHLGIMAANPLTINGNTYHYDFTDAVEKAYGNNSMKSLGNGYYGMYAGNANTDLIINHADRIDAWNLQAGKKGYMSADFSLDGSTNNKDKNDLWYHNQYQGSNVPD